MDSVTDMSVDRSKKRGNVCKANSWRYPQEIFVFSQEITFRYPNIAPNAEETHVWCNPCAPEVKYEDCTASSFFHTNNLENTH